MEVLKATPNEIELSDTHLTRVGKPIREEELVVAGIVNDVKQGTTKKGSPYGIIALQDYTDTYRFVIFNDDYINYNKYFTVGYFLLIKGKLESKYYNGKETEFKITAIHLLQGVRERLSGIMAESITKRIINARKANNGTTE